MFSLLFLVTASLFKPINESSPTVELRASSARYLLWIKKLHSDLKMSDYDCDYENPKMSHHWLHHEIVKKDLKVGTYRLPEDYATGPYEAQGDVKNENGDVRGVYTGAGLFQIKDGDTEIRGPNLGIGSEVSKDNVRLSYKAEVASVSTSAGAATATVGLSADTGIGIGKSGVEAKFLGTGFSVGRKTGFSLFGSGFEIDFSKW
ncbi:uncharacterized protein LOC132990130 [Labrus mixtus]|uniref:uncharacterized protein LOC132990130 n=1 Tax=Labrus mixtus TaxID=508554 RepID=UPI0029C0345F|nr:uncharacterized protein LOC132990130 [Labrus mixtus]